MQFVSKNFGVFVCIDIFVTCSVSYCSHQVHFLRHPTVQFLFVSNASEFHAQNECFLLHLTEDLSSCFQILSEVLLSTVGMSNAWVTLALNRVLETLWIMSAKLPWIVAE